MELKIVNGDYVPNGEGGFETVSGDEALLTRAAFRIKARRGAFPLMPELGSRVYLLMREKEAEREIASRLYITEALEDEPVSVGAVTLTESDDEADIRVELIPDSGGATLTLDI